MGSRIPSDPNVSREVAAFIAERDLFARSLGIELMELKPGFSRTRMQLAPHMINGLGLPHGAVIFALADFAFAAACNSHGRVAVALSMDIHFLSSPRADAVLEAVADEVRLGQHTGLYRITVVDQDKRLVAELHGMAYRKQERFLGKAAQEKEA